MEMGMNAGRKLGIEREMGMLVWELEGMVNRNPFSHTSRRTTANAYLKK